MVLCASKCWAEYQPQAPFLCSVAHPPITHSHTHSHTHTHTLSLSSLSLCAQTRVACDVMDQSSLKDLLSFVNATIDSAQRLNQRASASLSTTNNQVGARAL